MAKDQVSTGWEPPLLSTVVPAYNEQSRIGDTLSKMVAYLGAQDYTWELVVVDDGVRMRQPRWVGASESYTPAST